MLDRLAEIADSAREKLAAAKDDKDLEAMHISFLGRSGMLTEVLRAMGKLHKDVRAQVGQEANRIKKELETAIEERRESLKGSIQSARLL